MEFNLIRVQKNRKCFSHPARISTPATTWGGEAWIQQVRIAWVWLKLDITALETLLLSLVSGLLGISLSSRCHSIWTACPVTRGQSSLMTQVAVTGDPKGTTELDVWTFAQGCMPSSKNYNKKKNKDVMWRLLRCFFFYKCLVFY